MVKRYKVTTKITAAVLTLLMVVSVFSGAIELLPSFALSSEDYAVVTADDPTKLATQSSSSVPVGDITAKFTKDGGSTFKDSKIFNPSNFKDLTYSRSAEIKYSQADFYDINEGYKTNSKDTAAVGTWYTDGSVRRLNITLPLKSATNIKDIVLGGHSYDPVMRLGKYEIFASVDEADLFSAANSVALIDNTATGLNAKRLIDVQVKNNKLQNRNFVGISVYQPISTLNADDYAELVKVNGADILYTRICGIGVYGDYASATVNLDTNDGTQEIPSDIGEKAYATATAEMYNNGVKTVSEAMADGKASYKSVDGDVNTTPDYMAASQAWRYIKEEQSSAWSTTDASVRQKFFEDNTNTYTAYTFKLAKNFKPEKLLYIGSGSEELSTLKYEIYAADNETELYSESNKVFTYTNDTNNVKKRQVYSFGTFDGVDVNYIGFKVLVPVLPSKITYTYEYVVARVAEIGVYGTKTAQEADYTLTNDNDGTFPTGTSLVPAGDSKFDPVVTYHYPSGTELGPDYNDGKKSSLHDGTNKTYYTGDVGFGTNRANAIAYKSGSNIMYHTKAEGYYYDVTYDLGEVKSINSFFVLNHSNENIRLGSFEIYASETKADLFKDDSLVAIINSTGGKLRQVINLTTAIDARYVALVTDDVCANRSWNSDPGNHYLRLAEFNVYGASVEKITLADSVNKLYAVSGKTSAVKSLELRAKAATATSDAVASGYTKAVVDGKKREVLDVLTDNTTSVTDDDKLEFQGAAVFAKVSDDNKTEGIYTDGSAYADVIYRLKGETKISDIVVSSAVNSNWNMAYKLYAGNDRDTLFDGEPLYTHNPAARDTYTQHYTLKQVSARYVALRITACTTTDELSRYGKYAPNLIYPRLVEFGVYGTFTSDDVTVAEADSISAPTDTSVVASHKVYYYNGSNRNEVSIFSPPTRWYDNDLTTSAEGNNGSTPFAEQGTRPIKFYTDRYVDIVYNLKGTATVNKILVYNHPNVDLMTGEYSLYAGDDVNTLFTDANKLYTYKNNTTAPKRAQTFTLAGIKAKYVAMRITKAQRTEGFDPNGSGADPVNSYFRIYEFNVYGTEGSDYDPSQQPGEDDDKFEIPAGNNVLKGIVPSVVTTNPGENLSAGGCTNVANITDGDLSTGAFTGSRGGKLQFATNDLKGNKKWIGHGIDEGTVYTDFSFIFRDKKVTLEKLFVAHTATDSLRTKKYQIYVSDKTTTKALYKAENLVKTVDNSSGKRSNTITFDTPIENVRSIGIRVLDPCCSPYWTDHNEGHEVYPRLNEVAAIGSSEEVPVEFSEVTRSGSDSLPAGVDLTGKTDLVKNKILPKLLLHSVDEFEEETSGGVSPDKVSHMYDDDLSTQAMVSSASFGSYNKDYKKAEYYNTSSKDNIVANSRYLDIYYDLRGEAMLDNIKLAFPSNAIWALGRYDVYVGNDAKTLYDESNFYVSVDNLEAYADGDYSRLNVICFDQAKRPNDCKGRFVGIRVYDPTCTTGNGSGEINANQNHVYPRIHAFQVYGKYTDPTFDPDNIPGAPQEASKDDLKKIKETKKNLLENSTLYVFNEKGKKVSPVTSHKDRIFRVIKLYDGTIIHYDLNGAPFNADGFGIAFKIKEWDSVQFEGFAYQGLSSDNSGYWPGKYQLYASDDIDTLWEKDAMFYEFDADNYGLSRAQIIEFAKNKRGIGKYFGIKFVDINYSNVDHDYFRLSFLSVWGSEAHVPAFPGNLAENMPVDASFVNGSKRTEIDDNNLTPAELKRITDGNKSTYADINTSGKSRNTAELVYNLCGDDNVDKIAVTALINSTYGFKTMKVYSSSSYSGVFTEESLIWKYSVGSKTGKISPAKTFTKPKNMRYVRFVFEGTKSQLRLFEIEVIGLDNQKMKTRTISNGWSNEDISIIRTNKTTNVSNYASAYETLVAQLYDSEPSTFFSISDGLVSNTKYDLLIYLGDLRTVNRIDFNFLKRFKDYWPTKLNIYFGETEVDARRTSKPDYTINTANISEKSGSWSKDIRPMLARYMRVEIAGYPKNEIYKTKDGDYKINFVISDIKLTGTSVKGMQTNDEDERLITFTNNKTKSQLSLVRLDSNDIFTDVASIRVTPEKATNWQMRSLQSSGFMIKDKKIYKFELLDLYGNTVKDIGGRSITVAFKTPNAYKNGGTIIGNATQRTRISSADTYEQDGYSVATFTWDKDADNKFALCCLVTSDDPYWSSIGELENFKEGDASDLDGEVHDEEWYKSIHTTDNRFTVTPINKEFETGTKFVATDISAEATDSMYKDILTDADGKKVAVFYKLNLKKSGSDVEFTGEEAVDIQIALPSFVTDNFTDLEVRQLNSDGTVTIPWSEFDGTNLTTNVRTTDDIAIIGTAMDGSTSIGEGTNGTANPETGEKRTATAGAIMLLLAAGFVVTMHIRKSLHAK